MKHLSILALTVLIAACASIPGMPGHLNVTKSAFDNSTQISMEPGYVYGGHESFSGSPIQMSLLWRSTMEPDEVLLIVQVDGARNISSGDSLHFKVEGNLISFESIDDTTNIHYEPGNYSAGVAGQNYSSKRYVVSKKFIENIITASEVTIRLELSKSFVEGVFTDPKLNFATAHGAFKNFIEKAKQHGY